MSEFIETSNDAPPSNPFLPTGSYGPPWNHRQREYNAYFTTP